ncbi:MAG: polyphosphate polymerase domain-containing protein [Oscillospiraceae bacterium]|nr:polyphosphate polymerase domain-containing protein [Oscillospiraceae bacterium]
MGNTKNMQNARAFHASISRFERKYLLTSEQYSILKEEIGERMQPDLYPTSTISSLYFDTPSETLLTYALSGATFKEKLRIRTYTDLSPDAEVFVELKRKSNGTSYKRREMMTYAQAQALITDNTPPSLESENKNIISEIQYFLQKYENLAPKLYIDYDRESFVINEEKYDIRLTVDTNIRCRDYDAELSENIIDRNLHIMEVKSPITVPLWFARTLSNHGIYETSVSKYKTAYAVSKEKEISRLKAKYTTERAFNV